MMRILPTTFLVLAVSSSVSSAACSTGSFEVATNGLRLRDAPVDGTVLVKLPARSKLSVKKCDGVWAYAVALGTSYPEGWVHSDYLRPYDTRDTTRVDGMKRQHIREYCAGKWGTDYQMQRYCIDKQTEARAGVGSLFRRYGEGSEQQSIISRCAAKWQIAEGGYDWQMVEYCSKKQLEAYGSLQ